MEKNLRRPFKVIIVGAGISGLVLAHLLSRANIDHVILEAHKDIIHPAGGSFGVWPNAARILDQIGCWDDIESSYAPLDVFYIRQPDGSAFITSNVAAKIASE